MNKKLLALAVAGAFVAPVAMADSSNVVIYGTAAVSVDSVDGGSNNTAAGGSAPSITADNAENRMRVSSNTSIIGFKGSEDLGNGLSAIWQIENTVALDASGALAGARESFAGLSSKSWGSLTFGLRDTAYKLSTGKLDVFGGGNYLADYRSLFGGVTNGSIRASNSVTYISPSFNGFTVRGTTAAMQENGSSRSPRLWSASGTYENGPIFATLAYEDIKYAGVGGATGAALAGAGGNTLNTTAGAGNSAEVKQKNTRLGGGYNFGNLKVGLAWERAKVKADALTGTMVYTVSGTATTLTSVDVKRDAWYLSGAYTMGKNTLKAAYTRAGDLSGTSDTGAQQWTLGVSNALSKRTEVYALYTQVRNDSGAAYSLGGNPTNASGVATTTGLQSVGGTGVGEVLPGGRGEDPRGISVGMIHKF